MNKSRGLKEVYKLQESLANFLMELATKCPEHSQDERDLLKASNLMEDIDAVEFEQAFNKYLDNLS